MATDQKHIGAGKTFEEALNSALNQAMGGRVDYRFRWTLEKVTGEKGANIAGAGEDVVRVQISAEAY